MRRMTKRVNIKAPVAIRTITPPIYGTIRNIEMTTSDILKCLCRRAIVEEILDDGSTVRLSMKNYYLDNNKPVVVEIPKIEKPTVVNVVNNTVVEDPRPAAVIIEEEDLKEIEEPKEYTEEPAEEETVEESSDELEVKTEFVTGTTIVEEDETPTEEPVSETTVASTNAQPQNNNNNYNHKKKKHR